MTDTITLQFLLTILSNILLLIHHLISKRWMIRKVLLLISLILYQSRTPIDQKNIWIKKHTHENWSPKLKILIWFPFLASIVPSGYCCSKLAKVTPAIRQDLLRYQKLSQSKLNSAAAKLNSFKKCKQFLFSSMTAKFSWPWHSFEHLNVAARKQTIQKKTKLFLCY